MANESEPNTDLLHSIKDTFEGISDVLNTIFRPGDKLQLFAGADPIDDVGTFIAAADQYLIWTDSEGNVAFQLLGGNLGIRKVSAEESSDEESSSSSEEESSSESSSYLYDESSGDRSEDEVEEYDEDLESEDSESSESESTSDESSSENLDEMKDLLDKFEEKRKEDE